jgi:sulfur-oxidizing protein SoxX
MMLGFVRQPRRRRRNPPLDNRLWTLIVARRSRENEMQRGRGPAQSAPILAGLGLFVALVASGAASAQTPALPGQALAFDRSKGNCLTCHDIKGGDAPGNVGPPLNDMKKRFPDRKELAAIIFDESKRNPLTVMPPFGRNLILTGEEIEAVVDFLYTR